MSLRCKFHECLLTSPGVGPRSDSDEEAVAAVTFLEAWLEQQEVLHKSDEEEAMISTLEGSVGLVFFTSGSVLSPEPGSFRRERLAVPFLETVVGRPSFCGGFSFDLPAGLVEVAPETPGLARLLTLLVEG